MEERARRAETKAENGDSFFCGKTPVQLRFAAEGEPLAVLLKRYFLSQQGKNF